MPEKNDKKNIANNDEMEVVNKRIKLQNKVLQRMVEGLSKKVIKPTKK